MKSLITYNDILYYSNSKKFNIEKGIFCGIITKKDHNIFDIKLNDYNNSYSDSLIIIGYNNSNNVSLLSKSDINNKIKWYNKKKYIVKTNKYYGRCKNLNILPMSYDIHDQILFTLNKIILELFLINNK